MTVQLPYNPNPHPPGQAPIPVWVPHAPTTFPIQGFARVRWDPIRRPPTLSIPPSNTTFHLFKYLPPELRLRIWSFSVPKDRVIELRSWGSGRHAPVKITAHPHRLPTIFRVCKESRLEARRIYKFADIGISAAIKLDSRTYVPWEYHPTNPAADPSLTAGTAPHPYAEPHPPSRVRINWDHDIIYLGPEFKPEHLLQFFTSTGEGQELPYLQRLALGHKLFAGSEDGRWDVLRNCLYSLKSRVDFRELIIVPDDERLALVDRWYYGKHDIQLLDAEWRYKFHPNGGVEARSFVENLGDWFTRLWRDEFRDEHTQHHLRDPRRSLVGEKRPFLAINSNVNGSDTVEDDMESVSTLVAEDQVGRRPPDISIKSVRRNGKRMAEFKDGLWEIQEAIGDMRIWKAWTPPPLLETL